MHTFSKQHTSKKSKEQVLSTPFPRRKLRNQIAPASPRGGSDHDGKRSGTRLPASSPSYRCSRIRNLSQHGASQSPRPAAYYSPAPIGMTQDSMSSETRLD